MLRRNLTESDVLGHCLLDQLAADHQPIRVLQTDWWQMAGIRLSNDPPAMNSMKLVILSYFIS